MAATRTRIVTVRLDAASAAALEDIQSATGIAVTEALKRGLQALRDQVIANPKRTAYEYYRTLPVNTGPSAVASDSRRAVREAIVKKTERRRRPR